MYPEIMQNFMLASGPPDGVGLKNYLSRDAVYFFSNIDAITNNVTFERDIDLAHSNKKHVQLH